MHLINICTRITQHFSNSLIKKSSNNKLHTKRRNVKTLHLSKCKKNELSLMLKVFQRKPNQKQNVLTNNSPTISLERTSPLFTFTTVICNNQIDMIENVICIWSVVLNLQNTIHTIPRLINNKMLKIIKYIRVLRKKRKTIKLTVKDIVIYIRNKQTDYNNKVIPTPSYYWQWMDGCS